MVWTLLIFVNMSYQNRDKLNRLQRLLPEGLMADAAWLTREGYPSPLRSRYVASGWLEPVVRGVFRRPLHVPGVGEPAPLAWQHVVVSLQLVLERAVVVGGRTALEMQGFGHYASSGPPGEVHVYGDDGAPGWLGKLPLESAFVFHNARKLFRGEAIADVLRRLKANLAEGGDDVAHGSLTLQRFGEGQWPIVLSTPERAALELLDELPNRETFHQADALMDGLANLSPRRVDALLRECRSVKVRRLFLWFAERAGHAWLDRIDRDGVDLGRGKRMLASGGKLDARYGITVPEDLHGAR